MCSCTIYHTVYGIHRTVCKLVFASQFECCFVVVVVVVLVLVLVLVTCPDPQKAMAGRNTSTARIFCSLVVHVQRRVVCEVAPAGNRDHRRLGEVKLQLTLYCHHQNVLHSGGQRWEPS